MSGQPECAWCGDPAAEQVAMGSRRTDRWERLYAFLCTECADDTRREKDWSVTR